MRAEHLWESAETKGKHPIQAYAYFAGNKLLSPKGQLLDAFGATGMGFGAMGKAVPALGGRLPPWGTRIAAMGDAERSQ